MNNNLTALLSTPKNKTALKIEKIKSLNGSISKAIKKRYDVSLELSNYILDGYTFLSSPEFKQQLKENEIKAKFEDIILNAYGLSKSWYYKLLKASKIDGETKTQYAQLCDQLESEGKNSVRTIEDLIKFAKKKGKGTADGEDEKESKGANNVITFNSKEENAVSFKVTDKGEIKTNNTTEQIVAKLKELIALVEKNSK